MYIWHKLNVYLKNKNIQFEHATSNQIPTRAKHEQACRVQEQCLEEPLVPSLTSHKPTSGAGQCVKAVENTCMYCSTMGYGKMLSSPEYALCTSLLEGNVTFLPKKQRYTFFSWTLNTALMILIYSSGSIHVGAHHWKLPIWALRFLSSPLTLSLYGMLLGVPL